jgi:hypothetical protein
MSLPISESERRLLASTLMRDEEELTVESVDGAIEALRRRDLERRQRRIQMQIADAERRNDETVLGQLVREKRELDRALAGGPEGASPGSGV